MTMEEWAFKSREINNCQLSEIKTMRSSHQIKSTSSIRVLPAMFFYLNPSMSRNSIPTDTLHTISYIKVHQGNHCTTTETFRTQHLVDKVKLDQVRIEDGRNNTKTKKQSLLSYSNSGQTNKKARKYRFHLFRSTVSCHSHSNISLKDTPPGINHHCIASPFRLEAKKCGTTNRTNQYVKYP